MIRHTLSHPAAVQDSAPTGHPVQATARLRGRRRSRRFVVSAFAATTLVALAITALSTDGLLGLAWAESGDGAPAHAKPDHKSRHAKSDEASAAAAAQSEAVSAAGRAQICILDRTVILNTAVINVASAQRLAQLRQNAQNEVAEANRALQADGKALDADRRSPTDDGLKKARDALAERGRALQQRVALLDRQLQATQRTVNVQIQNAAAPILQAVEREQGCSLLLARDGVIDAQNTADITRVVLQRVDAQLKPQPFDLVQLAAGGPADGR